MEKLTIDIANLSEKSLRTNEIEETEVLNHSFNPKVIIRDSEMQKLTLKTKDSGQCTLFNKSIVNAFVTKIEGTGRNKRETEVTIGELLDEGIISELTLPAEPYKVWSVPTGEQDDYGRNVHTVHFGLTVDQLTA